jgi:MarR family transcriptional regulator, 2-MHQ and catechol-resistance regulon repressor
MARFPTLEERSERAFRGYMELLEAADWLRAELRLPLESFEVTMGEFRLLYLLHREGALPIAEVSRRRRSEWHNMIDLIARLEARGWVRRAVVRLPPVEWKRAHLAKSRRNEERRGRRLTVVGLTPEGKRFVRRMLPRHSKYVHALMWALDAREQDSLFRICRKLRMGNPVRFFAEITHEDDD